MTTHISARVEGRIGRLTLNRPEALHALNREMCLSMIDALLAWRGDPAVEAVLVEHDPASRGFCAGGDIRMLAESGAGDGAAARAFFHAEYRLNHLIRLYPKPYVALIDGVVMGGGVGISVHGSHRVATERTVFAMPETGIGLFPDVGGGWFLPRLPEPEWGTWAALTGARVKGESVLAAGVATHYAPSTEIPALIGSIIARGASALDGLQTVAASAVTPARGALVPLFGHDTMEEIVAALAAAGPGWPAEQLALLETKSPQTLKVALRQLRAGASMTDFADVMRMEYRIGARVVHRHDFREGVRAVIIDKDNAPRWDPATLSGVTDAMLDEIFAPLPPAEEWTPLA
jgi:enoyl-CoA hydratase